MYGEVKKIIFVVVFISVFIIKVKRVFVKWIRGKVRRDIVFLG